MFYREVIREKGLYIWLDSEKVSYRPDSVAKIKCNITNMFNRVLQNLSLVFSIEDSLGSVLYKEHVNVGSLDAGEGFYRVFKWVTPECLIRGFIARVKVYEGEKYLAGSTLVFDVVRDMSLVPRYGFFATFAADEDVKSRVDRLARFHINFIQFYDWFEYHGNYTPKLKDYFILRKPVHLDTVREKIRLSRERGIKCMAYIAIYAVDERIYSKYPEWALRNREGFPLRFADWLYLVNPGRECSFHDFLLEELKRSVESFGWNGIHLDQYGEGWTRDAYWKGRRVDVVRGFIEFINDARRSLNRDVVFNLVDAWPLEAVAREANASFIYIEVWSYETYASLQDLIMKARKLSGKPVVIAAYTDTHEPTVLLLDALIFANQGFRIELGEGNRYLVDPYFPKCRELPKPLENKLQNYYDVITRYEEYIYAPDVSRIYGSGIKILNKNYSYIPKPDTIQIIPYLKGQKAVIIHLINFRGISEMKWKSVQPEPVEERNIILVVPRSIIHTDSLTVHLVEADKSHEPKKLSYKVNGELVEINVPSLKYWDIIILAPPPSRTIQP